MQKNKSKRQSILDAAYQLVLTKGFERMTVQDILDTTGTSKGGFFHHFPSKTALLDGLVKELFTAGQEILIDTIDQDADALRQLQIFFQSYGSWKTTQRDYLMQILRVWYSDENAVVRQRFKIMSIEQTTPVLARIIERGVQDGSMQPFNAHASTGVALALIHECMDTLGRQLLEKTTLDTLQLTALAYADALEKVLGLPRHSILIVEAEMLEQWHGVAKNNKS